MGNPTAQLAPHYNITQQCVLATHHKAHAPALATLWVVEHLDRQDGSIRAELLIQEQLVSVNRQVLQAGSKKVGQGSREAARGWSAGDEFVGRRPAQGEAQGHWSTQKVHTEHQQRKARKAVPAVSDDAQQP
jgi:hypothetical protein